MQRETAKADNMSNLEYTEQQSVGLLPNFNYVFTYHPRKTARTRKCHVPLHVVSNLAASDDDVSPQERPKERAKWQEDSILMVL